MLSRERRSWVERDTPGETSELGSARIRVREEKRGARGRSGAHRVFVSATWGHKCDRSLHPRDAPARKIEERTERGGGEQGGGDELKRERILEVKIESFRSFSRS